MNDHVPVPSNLPKTSFILGYVGVIIALGMSAMALAKVYGKNPIFEQHGELKNAAINQDVDSKALSAVKPSENFATIQALNLAYCAEINFKLGNIARAQQILELLPNIIGSELQLPLQKLNDALKNYAAIDWAKLQASLGGVKDFYAQQLADGKFGQKTIAQVVKVQEQDFARKQHQFLEQVANLEKLIAAGRYMDLSNVIDNLLKAANELDANLADKSQVLSEFKEHNVISFEELLTALYDQNRN